MSRSITLSLRKAIMSSNYSLIIQWSPENGCFIASLPEWGGYQVEGESYEDALANAQQTIALLVKSFTTKGKQLPEARIFDLPTAVS